MFMLTPSQIGLTMPRIAEPASAIKAVKGGEAHESVASDNRCQDDRVAVLPRLAVQARGASHMCAAAPEDSQRQLLAEQCRSIRWFGIPEAG
jgi:hypothetical protein